MKTKFFGAFEKKFTVNIANKGDNTPTTNLIKLEQQFKFENDNSSCFAWGNFYDLKKTCSDLKIPICNNPAEAICHAVKDGNFQATEYFYGEFTFLIIENEKVIIGRDLVGAGLPVYYSEKYFSNSIDDFKNIKGFNFAPDNMSIQAFLHLGAPMPPSTLVSGIKQLLPGEYLIYSKQKITTHFIFSYSKYDQLFNSMNIPEQEAVEELERLHKEAIRRRVANKKHVALLMSGGYDSGGNVAALRDLYSGKVNGYSIGFKNDQWSELPLAKLLAKEFDIDFHDYEIDGSEIDDLPQILKYLGIPFQENGVMVNYTVMKRASKDANDIILGGDGNDQVYGTGMQQVALHHLTAKYGLKPFQVLLSGMLAGTNHKLLSKVHFHNTRILNATDYTTFGFSKSELKKLLNNSEGKLITNFLIRNQIKAHSFDELFKSHTYFKDFINDCNGLIIFKASNMAGLFNQHLSFPYMDKDSMEFIMQLPREKRVSGSVKEVAKGHSVGKYLHKKYLKPKLPKEITERKKQGGFAPLPIFFKDENRRKMIYQIIKNSQVSKELFNKKYLDQFLHQYELISQAKDAWFWHQQSMAFRIFNLLVLIIWWEIHFNNKKGKVLKDFV